MNIYIYSVKFLEDNKNTDISDKITIAITEKKAKELHRIKTENYIEKVTLKPEQDVEEPLQIHLNNYT